MQKIDLSALRTISGGTICGPKPAPCAPPPPKCPPPRSGCCS